MDIDLINRIAAAIRRVDGGHTMGAGALAEAIVEDLLGGHGLHLVTLSDREVQQIVTALENRGDDRNSDPHWRALHQRLMDLPVGV